ncbi:MAG TPA: DMT family transporter [Candidatus Polarisedimenticolia bacterium]|nr:DMT family transporter [Candidatus Polarisedimenticolia bacterium]
MAVRSRSVIGLILAAAAWGIGTVISKRAVDEVPPLTLIAIQLSASVLLLALLMRSRGIPLRGDHPALLGRLGILNPGIAYALSLVGLVTVSASLSVLLWALEPLLILGLAALVLRERVTASLVLASVGAAAGAVLVIGQPEGGQLVGVVLTIAGVVCCAVYTIICRRFIAASDGTAPVVLAQQVHALVFMFLVVGALAITGSDVGLASITPIGLASAVTSGVLYYAAAYWFYLSALRDVPASIASTAFYLIPVFGLAGANVLLGERLEPQQWLGAALILAAILTILRRQVATTDATRLVAST